MYRAVCSTSAALFLHWYAFQSSQPIGGVRARPLSSAAALGAVTTAVTGTRLAASMAPASNTSLLCTLTSLSVPQAALAHHEVGAEDDLAGNAVALLEPGEQQPGHLPAHLLHRLVDAGQDRKGVV